MNKGDESVMIRPTVECTCTEDADCVRCKALEKAGDELGVALLLEDNERMKEVVEVARKIQRQVIKPHDLPPFALYGELAYELEEALRRLDGEET